MKKTSSNKKLTLSRLTIQQLKAPAGGWRAVSFRAGCSGSCNSCIADVCGMEAEEGDNTVVWTDWCATSF